MTLHRAYSLLEVKEMDQEDDFHVVRGVATTPAPDRMNDIVDPMGAEYAETIPLLWQHDSDKPVGHTQFGKATKNGIPFTARIPVIKEAGALKDRVDEAIQSLKYRLVAAVSIGFRVLEDGIKRLDNGGLHFTKTEIMELSLVTIPANPQAVIEGFKSMDPDRIRAALAEPSRAATGQKRTAKLNEPAGASARKPVKPKEASMDIAQNIKDWEAKRAATVAQMEELMAKSVESGETMDEEQDEQYEGLAAEVKAIDKQLGRLREMEALQASKAQPVADVSKTVPKTPDVVVKNIKDPDDKFEGQSYTRMVIAKTLAQLEQRSPIAIARERWGKTNPMLVEVIKADVEGGGSGSGEWGAELVQADTRFTGDFIEYLDSRTVFNQLPLREVPAHVTIKGQDGTGTGYWVGESAAIPVSAQDFSDVSLTPLKVAALAVISNELMRDSSPSAEMLVRDGLVNAAVQRIDTTFLGTAAASAGVSPAGLLNGVTGLVSAGTDYESVRLDIAALYDVFINAKNAMGLYLVMHPGLAKRMSFMVNELGQVAFPSITATGGNLLGDPVVTGENVGSTHMILLKPSDIYRIGDGGLQVAVSREATIEMESSPAGDSQAPTAPTGKTVSMFQTESTAIKVVRSMNFAKRRAHAAQYISDAAYGTVTSS